MKYEIAFATDIAKQAGDILMQYFGTELTRNIKRNENDYSTEADHAAEEFIIKEIEKEFPNDAIIAEESGTHDKRGSEYTWIIDPLDGTHNFANGSENFGVMISRAKDKEIVLAVIYNPVSKTLATSEKGQGVKLNEEHITLPLQDTAVDKPLSVENDHQEILKHIGYGATTLGASSNTLVTLQGERRGFVSGNGYIWDFAPPVLMLAEAGWKVTDFAGQPFIWDGNLTYGHPGIIAAPEELHTKLLNTLKDS